MTTHRGTREGEAREKSAPPETKRRRSMAPSVKEIYGRESDLVEGYGSWVPTAVKITRNLWKLSITPYEQLILRVAVEYRFSIEGKIPSLLTIERETGISHSQLLRCIESLESKHLIRVTRPERKRVIRNDGKEVTHAGGKAALIDLAPLLTALCAAIGKEEQKKRAGKRQERHTQVALAASTLAQSRKESAHLAPVQTPIKDDWPVPNLDTLESRLAALLANVATRFQETVTNKQNACQRISAAKTFAGWDDAALADAIAASAAQAESRARGRKFDLFFPDLDRRARDAHLVAEKAAAERQQQEQEYAAILAIPLSAKAQRCEALLREQDWPGLPVAGMRLFSGEDDWLWLLHLNQDETVLDDLLERLAPSDQGEQDTGAVQIEQEDAAPIDQADIAAPPICGETLAPVEEQPLDWAALALSPSAERLRQRLEVEDWPAMLFEGYAPRKERGWYAFFESAPDDVTINSAAQKLTERLAKRVLETNHQKCIDVRRATPSGSSLSVVKTGGA